jgi:citrate lyase subunit beta/citryl-CoA lyase
VPADRPERFDKAFASGADAVIIDLEDAVAPSSKAAARAGLLDRLHAQTAPRAILRINGADTEWFDGDLALCAAPGVAAVMLPKAECAETIAALRAAGAKAVLPLIESAAGFAALDAIASAPGVQRLAFGSIDFQVDLGMRDALEEELLYFRSQIVLASCLAGLAAPIDGVSTAIDDAERLHADVLRARRLGFGGKLCIHSAPGRGRAPWLCVQPSGTGLGAACAHRGGGRRRRGDRCGRQDGRQACAVAGRGGLAGSEGALSPVSSNPKNEKWSKIDERDDRRQGGGDRRRWRHRPRHRLRAGRPRRAHGGERYRDFRRRQRPGCGASPTCDRRDPRGWWRGCRQPGQCVRRRGSQHRAVCARPLRPH